MSDSKPPSSAPQDNKSGFFSYLAVLRIRNFRLLWLGEAISLLGDQFYMIALPWLVLRLTNDPFAMGTVLAIAGIPRAIFMLVGGAITDRFSSRNVMLVSNIVRGILVSILTLLVFTESIQIWMLYVLALAFGIADAFFFPASGSIVPQVVEKDHLQAGNALVQGTAQISVFSGPVLAGLLIALTEGGRSVAGGETTPDTRGIAISFGFDSLTFLVSAITLWQIRLERKAQTSKEEESSVISSIKEGLNYVLGDVTLRTWFIIIAGLNLFFNGPIAVGIPVLADTRFPEGAAAFGIIIAGFGAGSLVGTILSGLLPRLPDRYMGSITLVILSSQGIGLMLLGWVQTTALATMVTVLIGITNGYIFILWVTWLQSITPPSMLGRVWSLLMFAGIGIQPLSNALAGALINISVEGLFFGAGLLFTLMNLVAAMNPAVRSMVIEAEDTSLSVAEAIRRTGEIPAVAPIRRTGEIPAIALED